jgi:hypothetical protein
MKAGTVPVPWRRLWNICRLLLVRCAATQKRHDMLFPCFVDELEKHCVRVAISWSLQKARTSLARQESVIRDRLIGDGMCECNLGPKATGVGS